MGEDAKGNLRLVLVVLSSIVTGYFFAGGAFNSWIIGLLTFGVLLCWFGIDALEGTLYSAISSKGQVQEVANKQLWDAIAVIDQRLDKLQNESTLDR